MIRKDTYIAFSTTRLFLAVTLCGRSAHTSMLTVVSLLGGCLLFRPRLTVRYEYQTGLNMDSQLLLLLPLPGIIYPLGTGANHLNRLGFDAALAVAPSDAFVTLDAVGRIKLLPALPFRVSPALLGLEVERLFIVLLAGLAGILLVKLLILLVEERPPL